MLMKNWVLTYSFPNEMRNHYLTLEIFLWIWSGDSKEWHWVADTPWSGFTGAWETSSVKVGWIPSVNSSWPAALWPVLRPHSGDTGSDSPCPPDAQSSTRAGNSSPDTEHLLAPGISSATLPISCECRFKIYHKAQSTNGIHGEI